MEKIRIILGDDTKYSITTTTDLLSMIKTLVIEKKIPVGLFSMNATNVQVVTQLTFSSVPEMKNERLSKTQWEKASDFISIMENAPLYLDDTKYPTYSEIQDKIMQLKKEHGVRVFAFDRWPSVCGEITNVMEEMARTCDAIFLVRHAR